MCTCCGLVHLKYFMFFIMRKEKTNGQDKEMIKRILNISYNLKSYRNYPIPFYFSNIYNILFNKNKTVLVSLTVSTFSRAAVFLK